MGVSHLKETMKETRRKERKERKKRTESAMLERMNTSYSPPVTNNVGTTHRHIGTQAHRHTGTQAHRHTGTQAHTTMNYYEHYSIAACHE